MENFFVEAVKLVNPVQLILINLIVFYFYARLDKKIEKFDIKQENAIKDVRQDIKYLSQRIDDTDKDFRQQIKVLNHRIDSLYQLIVSVYKNVA
ncbi:MAG TPA: hypothetical protein P5556_07005 [Candidatus Gastranaerophilales bacterium]|nr:hypothetical protein [Candidatus Gastranaerophilales bacterium]